MATLQELSASRISESFKGNEIKKSTSIESIFGGIVAKCNDSLEKGFITEHEFELAINKAEDIAKAAGHKYFKREGIKGKYKYYYTEAEYNEAKGIKGGDKKEGGVWTKEQEGKVKENDSAYQKHLEDNKIDRHSKEAADAWKDGGFKDKQKEIFGKKEGDSGAKVDVKALAEKWSFLKKDLEGKTGEAEVVVSERDTSGMRGSQDKYKVELFQNGKKIADLGSVPSNISPSQAAKMFSGEKPPSLFDKKEGNAPTAQGDERKKKVNEMWAKIEAQGLHSKLITTFPTEADKDMYIKDFNSSDYTSKFSVEKTKEGVKITKKYNAPDKKEDLGGGDKKQDWDGKSTTTSLGKVGGYDLIYETFSKMNGGDGVSGTIRTKPQNYYVGDIDSSGKFETEKMDAAIKNLSSKEVESLWGDKKKVQSEIKTPDIEDLKWGLAAAEVMKEGATDVGFDGKERNKKDMIAYLKEEIAKKEGGSVKLKVGEDYKTDSGMGGTFTVKYKGKDSDGKNVFENVTNKDFKGAKYTVSDDKLDSWIKKSELDPYAILKGWVTMSGAHVLIGKDGKVESGLGGKKLDGGSKEGKSTASKVEGGTKSEATKKEEPKSEKSLEEQKKFLDKKVDRLAGKTAVSSSQDKKLKEAVSQLGEVKKKLEAQNKESSTPKEKAKEVAEIKMNNLDWGNSTAERNENLDKFNSLKTKEEKESFKKELKDKTSSKEDTKEEKSITEKDAKVGRVAYGDGGMAEIGDKISMRTKNSGGTTSGVDGEVYEISANGKGFRLKDPYGNKDSQWRNVRDYKSAKVSRGGDVKKAQSAYDILKGEISWALSNSDNLTISKTGEELKQIISSKLPALQYALAVCSQKCEDMKAKMNGAVEGEVDYASETTNKIQDVQGIRTEISPNMDAGIDGEMPNATTIDPQYAIEEMEWKKKDLEDDIRVLNTLRDNLIDTKKYELTVNQLEKLK